jgi:hypothetical protein
LQPWAAFLRRFAAQCALCFPLYLADSAPQGFAAAVAAGGFVT